LFANIDDIKPTLLRQFLKYVCPYFLNIPSDLDKVRYRKCPRQSTKLIMSFVYIQAIKVILYLGTLWNLYPHLPHLFSGLCEIQHKRSWCDVVGHLWASWRWAQATSNFFYTPKWNNTHSYAM